MFTPPATVTITPRTGKWSDWADCSGCPQPGTAVRRDKADAHRLWHRTNGSDGTQPEPTPEPVPVPVPVPPTTSRTPWLPYDLPDLRPVGGKVFAHWWPPLQISWNQSGTDYWDQYIAGTYPPDPVVITVGGLMRDRPPKRAPSASPTWLVDDCKNVIRQYADAGVDGFAMNIIVIPGATADNQVTHCRAMAQAARDTGFLVWPELDMGGNAGASIPATAAFLVELATTLGPFAYRDPQGRLYVTAFLAEAQPVTWWTALAAEMKTRGQDVALWPTFLTDARSDGFAPISVGAGYWGNRSPAANGTAAVTRANTYRTAGFGRLFLPVAVQDSRPREGIFDEARGTENLRAMIDVAIAAKAEAVQVITVQDHYESTQTWETVRSGKATLDLVACEVARYKLGQRPTVVRDALYVAHRTHPYGAAPSDTRQTKRMTVRGGSNPVVDEVEVTAYLTAADTLTMPDGSTRQAPAGFSAHRCPLQAGTVTARTGRGVTVTSKTPVVTQPKVQDMTYVFASSLRPAP